MSEIDEHTIRRLSAEVLGCKAFGDGKKRIPAQDGDLMPLLAGYPVGGAGIAILDAWLNGWDTANINKPWRDSLEATK